MSKYYDKRFYFVYEIENEETGRKFSGWKGVLRGDEIITAIKRDIPEGWKLWGIMSADNAKDARQIAEMWEASYIKNGCSYREFIKTGGV